jgi:hypothetical protein
LLIDLEERTRRRGLYRDLAIRAATFLASAGRRALDRDDINAALNPLSRAVDISPLYDPQNLSIRLRFADVFDCQASPSGQVKCSES